MLSDLVAMFDGVPDLKAVRRGGGGERSHEHQKACKSTTDIFQIVIVWNDVSAPLPDPLLLPLVSSTSGAAVPVRVVSAERNTLNNRFLPLDLVTTDCVFQVCGDKKKNEVMYSKLSVGFFFNFHRWMTILATSPRKASHMASGSRSSI